MIEIGNIIWDQKILEVKMTAQPNEAKPEDYVVFKIIAKNSGDSQLCRVSIKDDLPDGMRYVSDSQCGKSSGGVVTWQDLGPILPGEMLIIELTACIKGSDDGDKKGPWLNRAAISSVSEKGIKLGESCSFEVLHKENEEKAIVLYGGRPKGSTLGTHRTFFNRGSTIGTHIMHSRKKRASKISKASVSDIGKE